MIDLLKNMTSQALRLNIAFHDERSLALSCSKFCGAETETEWLDLLGSVLVGFPQVYIIIDVEAVITVFRTQFSWPSAFLALFQNLCSRGVTTNVKVVLVSYGSPFSQKADLQDLQHLVIPAGRPVQSSAQMRRNLPCREKVDLATGVSKRSSRYYKRGFAYKIDRNSLMIANDLSYVCIFLVAQAHLTRLLASSNLAPV